MSASFTPGPWDSPMPTEISAKSWADLRGDCPMQFVTVGWDGWTGETVAIVYGDDEEQEAANARLIASAPALYKALTEARTFAANIIRCHRGDPEADPLIQRIDAALKQARNP
jgi:hypothetical protein